MTTAPSPPALPAEPRVIEILRETAKKYPGSGRHSQMVAYIDALLTRASGLYDENQRLRGVNLGSTATFPTDIQEWIWHLDLHLTEHDEQHAGRALRAAWPAVRDFFAGLRSSYIQWRHRAEAAEQRASALISENQRLKLDVAREATLLPEGRESVAERRRLWERAEAAEASAQSALARVAELERDAARTCNMQDGPPIPWKLAEAIWQGYALCGGRNQPLQRVHERGGFGWDEVAHIWKRPKAREAILAALKA